MCVCVLSVSLCAAWLTAQEWWGVCVCVCLSHIDLVSASERSTVFGAAKKSTEPGPTRARIMYLRGFYIIFTLAVITRIGGRISWSFLRMALTRTLETRMCKCSVNECVYSVSLSLCVCIFLSGYHLPASITVCLFPCLPALFSLSHSVCFFHSLSLSVSLFLSIHLCVYLAYGPDPACSPRFMKCEQLSRWCISYSGRLCVGFVPQTKAYDTCEPLVAQTHRHRGSSGC